MQSSLGIHLEKPPTTRRADRRVVLVLGAVIAGLCMGYLATRLPYVIAETVGVQPKHTVASMRILKTPGNARILREQFGSVLPLDGLPVTFGELLRYSKNEITLHVDNEGHRAIALDVALPESVGKTFAAFGYKAWVGKNTTLIVLHNVDVGSNAPSVLLGALSPWYDGELSLITEKTHRFGFAIGNGRITLHGIGTPGAPIDTPTVPEASEVVLAASITENTLPLLGVTETLEAITATSQFSNALTQTGAAVVLTKDAEGYGYFLSIPTPTLTVEELATLGKEIANRESLSTVLWTSEDGERYAELRASPDVTVEISAEQDYSFVNVHDTEGKLVRLTKTPDILMIANRALGIREGVQAKSSCLAGAHSWATSGGLLTLNEYTDFTDIVRTLLMNTKEIAVGTGSVRICW